MTVLSCLARVLGGSVPSSNTTLPCSPRHRQRRPLVKQGLRWLRPSGSDRLFFPDPLRHIAFFFRVSRERRRNIFQGRTEDDGVTPARLEMRPSFARKEHGACRSRKALRHG